MIKTRVPRSIKSRLVRGSRQRLAVDRLEDRLLLAVSYGPKLVLDSGDLSLDMDEENDVVSLAFVNADTARLTVNGVPFDYPASAIRALHFDGGGGDDQIEVGPEVNIGAHLNGGAGNDLLVGGSGSDSISGQLGNDTLIGGAGDDNLDATDGRTCHNGADSDVLVNVCGPAFLSESIDSVLGGEGDDFLSGDPAVDFFDGGPGTNEIIIPEPSGDCLEVSTDDIDSSNFSIPDTILFEYVGDSTARATVNGLVFDYSRSQVPCFVANTGGGDDSIVIHSAMTIPSALDGSDGNDTLIGGAGDDFITGGAGNDVIQGQDGNDSALGGVGDDSIDGGNGDDSLAGEEGNDTILGGPGNDMLDGGPGNDSLAGGEGDDTLTDGMGNDTLDGGTGNDMYMLTPGSDDVVRDSRGGDTLGFTYASRGISLDLSLQAGQRQVVDANGNTVALHGVIEHVTGSFFADDISGNTRPNRINGGGGDDTLDGGGADRALHGGTGRAATDRRAGEGCDGDTLDGGPGNDWLDGGRGRDILDGGYGDDVMVADATQDSLTDSIGNNQTIAVTKNTESCTGGAIAAAVPQSPVIFDESNSVLAVSGDEAGPTNDTILLSLAAGGFLEVSLNGTVRSSDPTSVDFDPALTGASNASIRFINIQGLARNDVLTLGDGFSAASGQITLEGGAGDDQISGGSAAELLIGDAGNDVLSGGSGDDTLVGGLGNDRIDGGAGSDTADFSSASQKVKVDLGARRQTARGQGSDSLAAIENVIGSMFDDLLIGGAGVNRIRGGDGNDVIRGGDGNDFLDGGRGNDRLDGGRGNDALVGAEDSDVLLGRTGMDLLDGGDGADSLSGGDDADTLQGGADNDFLFGERGDDSLDGASGNDTIDGGSGTDSLVAGEGIDQLFVERNFDRVVADMLDSIRNSRRPSLELRRFGS